MEAALRALKPGGRMLIWVYGREGNELYLSFAQPLRLVTTRLPRRALLLLSRLLEPALSAYSALSEGFRLPMAQYMRSHIAKLSREQRALTIYDQLNPDWARYYRRGEAEDLLQRAGFQDIHSRHRHGYSWTVVGTKPSHPLHAE